MGLKLLPSKKYTRFLYNLCLHFLEFKKKRIILIFKLKIKETMLQWQIVITKFKIRGFGSNQAQKEDFSWKGGGGGVEGWGRELYYL